MVCLLAPAIGGRSGHAQMAPATNVGVTSATQTVTMTITTAGTTNATLGTAIQVVTQGTAGLDFSYVSGGTCAVNAAYTVGQTCTVEFSFTPTAPGLRLGAIELFTATGTQPLATTYIYGTGEGPLAAYTPGIISTVAGNGSIAFNGPPDGDGGLATQASFFNLTSVSLDGAGNMYLVDSSNGFVRKVTAATGIINPVAGGGQLDGTYEVTFQPGSACPGAPSDTAVDTYGDGCPAYNATNQWDSAIMYGPNSVIVDGAGNLYVAEATTVHVITTTETTYPFYLVRKVSAATGIITTVAGGGTATFTANSACPGTPADTATDTLGDGCPGFNTTTPADSATLAGPYGIAVDGEGNLYIADGGNQRIRKVSATTGVITSVAGNGTAASSGDGGLATSASVYDPISVAVDGANNLYIVERNTSNRVREVTASNGFIQTIAGGGTATFTAGSPCPGTSSYTATDSLGDGCPAYNAATPVDSAELSYPDQVVLDAAGNLYVSDPGNQTGHNIVRKITAATGIITNVAGNLIQGFAGDGGAATRAELAAPSGIAVDPQGNLYIADQLNERVRKVNPSSSALAFEDASIGSTSPDSPQTVTVSNNGTGALGLAFTPPGAGAMNPSVAENFSYNNSSSCDQIGPSGSFTLPSGESCSAMISFTPTVQGSIGGSMVLTDDSAAGTTQTVALSGTGTPSGTSLALSIGPSPASFAQGEEGLSYTLTPSNALGVSTTGTLTLVDTLPAGITATAMTGTGWTCTLATTSCTSNTPIAGVSNGNAVTLTVSIAANAVSGVNNAVLSSSAISDGPSASASDPTTVAAQQIAFVVNTTIDPASGNAANCAPDNADTCSLRDAMTGANLANTASSITFDSNIFPTSGASPVTITLSSSLPSINAANTAPTITGPGQSMLILSGSGGTYSGLNVSASTATVALSGMTFSGFNTSAINNTGTTTLTDVTATDGTGGNAIVSSGGTLTLNSCSVTNNTVAVSTGGVVVSAAVDNSGGTLNINNSTITGNTYTVTAIGPTALEGGGIANASGTLNVRNSTVSGNALTLTGYANAAAAAFGGGIYNAGTATISVSTIGSNGAGNSIVVTSPGGSASAEGGGIYNGSAGELTITGSSVGTVGASGTSNSISATAATSSKRSAAYGGGIAQLDTAVASFSMSSSTVTNNTATTAGNALAATGAEGAGIYSAAGLTLDGSTGANTISGNIGASSTTTTSDILGGGIYTAAGPLILMDATVSGNSATSGGGIYVNGTGASALTNVTITGNIASNGVGGMMQGSTGTTVLNNITLVDNLGATEGFSASTAATGANNILAGCAPDECPTGNTNPASVTDLGSLGNNGGGVLTMLPAIGSTAQAAGLDCTTTADERGYPRNTCDLGAVRVEPSGPPATVTVMAASISSGTADATLSASVEFAGSTAPTGAFTFQVDSGIVTTAVCIGTTSPLSCTASYPTSALTATEHTITGTLAADVNFNAATGTNTLSVTAATQTTTVSSISAAYGSTTGIMVTAAESGAAGAATGGIVTFGTAGSVGGSFSPATCTLLATGTCTTVYTPSGTLAAGVYNSDITASFTAVGNYSVASATSNLSVSRQSPVLTLSSVTTVTYPNDSNLSVSLAWTGSGAVPTGAVTFSVDSGTARNASCSGTATPITCTYSGSFAAGTHTLTASYAGDTNYAAAAATPESFTIAKTTLTLTANDASRLYGAANPAFTGSMSGAQSADDLVESFTTSATTLSPVATYAIVPAVTGSNVSSYAENIVNGTLTIAPAPTSITLSASSTSIASGQNVTFTAQVSPSTSGIPTGIVTLLDNGGPLAILTLNGGSATYATTALSPGITHVLTASYGGDSNFLGTTASGTPAGTVAITVSGTDTAITSTSGSSFTVIPGGALSFDLLLTPQPGAYPGPVTFTISGLPPGASATFTPQSLSAITSPTTVHVTIQTAASIAKLMRRRGDIGAIALSLLLIPIGCSRRTRKRLGTLSMVAVLLGGVLSSMIITGCGSGGGFLRQEPQNYTVTITATSGSVQHVATITLNIQ